MVNRALVSFGRFLLAAIFLYTAYKDATGLSGLVAHMKQKGIPFTEVLAVGQIALKAVGGLMVATGFQPRIGALLLILFLIPTTLLFHPFTDPAQQIQFLKNLAILGGLCVVVGSFDGRRRT